MAVVAITSYPRYTFLYNFIQGFSMKKGMGLLWVLLANSVYASPPWHSSNIGTNFMWTIAGGPAWASSGQPQSMTNISGTAVVNSSSSDHQAAIGVGELFLGVYKELNNAVQGQLGVEIAYGGNVGVSGTISNVSYSYKVYQTRVAVKGKLVLNDLPMSSLIQPYVSAGLGEGFNNSINYSLNPPTANQTYPLYSNKSVQSLTYTAGGGIQIPFSPFMQVGIGYEYANWGKSGLGSASGFPALPEPAVQNININTLLVSLSYTA